MSSGIGRPEAGPGWRARATAAAASALLLWGPSADAQSYTIVDTGQTTCYDTDGRAISCTAQGRLSGQDGQHTGRQPRYRDNGDGTIGDLNTGLMWQRSPGDKVTWAEAVAAAASVRTGGYGDWRLPTIKELYSLIDFSGVTGISAGDSIPYIDTGFFDFSYGDESVGERHIDAQYCSSTEYVSTTMNGDHTVFGVNFADGRIKGYGTVTPRGPKSFYALYVRGSSGYGRNDLVDNGDGTITDRATGLMWTRTDSGMGVDWEDALGWVEQCNLESYGGHSDWRLPNAKELQSIVDYTRAPDVTGSAAIDPIFSISRSSDGGFPYFWTSTTHLDGRPETLGSAAVYVAFGRALGYMETPPFSGNIALLDVHGAGAQRSDPKYGDPGDYPYGRGPQGDVIRIFNHVRCVRDSL